MKTIEKYVFQSFLTAFFLTWLVLSFVLTIGLLVKIARLVVQGVSVQTIGQFMMIGFPETLTFTLPLSLLVSSLLVFGRLSADSEIAAMRACGINLLSIMKYPLIFAACCTLLGFYVNNEIVPRANKMVNNMKSLITVDTGLKLLEPGRVINEFPQIKLYFTRKEGNWIYGLRANDFTDPKVSRQITADKALISTNGNDIVLDMYNVSIDPIDADRPGRATMGRFTHTIRDAMKPLPVADKEKHFTFKEMRGAFKTLRENTLDLPEPVRQKYLSICRTLFQKRFAEAFACICFVLVGVPLGIKAHRKDSTIGMAISLIVAMSHYLMIIAANELQKSPAFYPHLLMWLSAVLCFALAAVLIPRNL